MKLITRRQHSASIYEVFAYGRHDHLYQVRSRIEGLTGSFLVGKGITRNEAIQLATDKAGNININRNRPRRSKMKTIAKDGTVFGAYNQGNGDYIASEDDHGTHYAPAQYAILPDWDDDMRRERLAEAVAEYNMRIAQEKADEPARRAEMLKEAEAQERWESNQARREAEYFDSLGI